MTMIMFIFELTFKFFRFIFFLRKFVVVTNPYLNFIFIMMIFTLQLTHNCTQMKNSFQSLKIICNLFVTF